MKKNTAFFNDATIEKERFTDFFRVRLALVFFTITLVY
jgi:hypothetical protein